MTTRDERIGQSVVLLRGERSQQAVADAMRKRGHKWSQATVWSVEKGERPLRLTEAEDLAQVLGVSPWQFGLAPDDLTLMQKVNGTETAFDRFRQAVFQALDAQKALIKARDLDGHLGDPWRTPHVVEAVEEWCSADVRRAFMRAVQDYEREVPW